MSARSEYRGTLHQRQKDLMTRWYERLAASAAGSGPAAVAMMISGNCVELLESFGLVPLYPEINALQLAIRHQALEPILAAEDIGYAADNCAYVKADVGAWLKGITPTGSPMPVPALTLCNFVGCNTYLKWFEHTAAFTGSPLYVIDGAPNAFSAALVTLAHHGLEHDGCSSQRVLTSGRDSRRR